MTSQHAHPEIYRFVVKGHLDEGWSDWFDGLTITSVSSGETILTGPLVDQTALHGVLIKIRDLGLPLIAVIPGGVPTGVFVTMHGDEHGPTLLRKET